MAWVFDADFGWYDDADPLGNIPNLAKLPGTDVLRDPGGTYHPDIYATGAMPDPVITNLLDAEPSRRSSVSAETVTPVPEDSDHAPLQVSMTFSV
mgnify:CR=1 FL=1